MSNLKSSELYQSLRTRIIDGDYQPGDRLVLRRIAHEYDVSEIPVREAIRMLERDGLVEMIPYTGARVVTLSPQTIRESLFVRGHLESIATGLAANLLTESQLDELDALITEMETAAASQSTVNYAEMNRTFHGLINTASGNQVLCDTLADLEGAQIGFQALFRLRPHRFEVSLQEHREILGHLRARDAKAASEVALRHKLGASAELEAFFLEHNVRPTTPTREKVTA
ncbi:GntR family transcriptional regulator [Solwaraspora sp. WMMD406]|uniref:GntR family transcriptional regulator n=1 Tax=Solwaraspora sp. WMMD406 TaxID=3016095 RepID=UPI00241752A3|nr:GntR family transcriptional regulator [Solwaraspora sp. WMMD406]MDG4763170.1 GntR family transcriptional regulator [Solwaraspora sp. WMMD406]